MGWLEDIGSGLEGAWNDVTGKTQRDARGKMESTQDRLNQQSQDLMNQGNASTAAASNYWNRWLNDPSAAWNATMPTAMNTGAGIAGGAVNSAVNMARGSGLNAGQAALAGGGQAANSFSTGTLGAQNALVGVQNNAAQGQSSQGTNQQANATATGVNLAEQQQQNFLKQQNRTDNLLGQVTGKLKDPLGVNGDQGGDQGGQGGGAQNAAATAAKVAAAGA